MIFFLYLVNAQSFRHKVDELTSLINAKKELNDCCLIAITETWLDSSVPDESVTIPGFKLFRSDHDFSATGKETGGGLCLMVNQRWCSDAKIISHSCSYELETLNVRCRPFYLPRELSSLVITVYIPDRKVGDEATNQLAEIHGGTKTLIQMLLQ